ncbi:MAG: hypothetical protein ACRDHZ_25490, partial [Ktedonobacteraceae bacterium]
AICRWAPQWSTIHGRVRELRCGCHGPYIPTGNDHRPELNHLASPDDTFASIMRSQPITVLDAA